MFMLNFSYVLVAAAVIPALYLLNYVYRMDWLEQESKPLLWSLVFSGIISTIIASVFEIIGQLLLGAFFNPDSLLFGILMYYGVVACSEEGAKYWVMKRKTWNNPEFNCTFDGIVYATFVSLGFALWENIKYVFAYGFQTAVIRAVTAVPGHACFGVFMGLWYGLAKLSYRRGNKGVSDLLRKLSLLVPVLLHGTYDFLATRGTEKTALSFFVFVIIMFIAARTTVKRSSDKDRYIL